MGLKPTIRIGIFLVGLIPSTVLAGPEASSFAVDRCPQEVEASRRQFEASPADLNFQISLARALARCQQYGEAIERFRESLKAQPHDKSAQLALGQALLRSHRTRESIESFQTLLQYYPADVAGTLGLADALAADGQYSAATAVFDELLRKAPENYDALQGKAFALTWAQQYELAKPIFYYLTRRQPRDPENPAALESIARAQEEARWAAVRPPPDAPPGDFERFYRNRLVSRPGDLSALKALADIESQMGELTAAIRNYQSIVARSAHDVDAEMALARVLVLDRQYDAAMKIYTQTAKSDASVESLHRIADALIQANRVEDALSVYRDLAAKDPARIEYFVDSARLELGSVIQVRC